MYAVQRKHIRDQIVLCDLKQSRFALRQFRYSVENAVKNDTVQLDDSLQKFLRDGADCRVACALDAGHQFFDAVAAPREFTPAVGHQLPSTGSMLPCAPNMGTW